MIGLRRDPADLRWHAAGIRSGNPPGLIPFLGSLLGLYGTYKAIEAASAPPPPPPLPYPIRGVTPGLALPPGAQRAAGWLVKFARKYGSVIAQAIWNAYQELRIQGLGEAESRRLAIRQHVGNGGGAGRRRMNPTNVKALRRAIRRVRSFQRVTGKVNRLLPRKTRGGGGYFAHYHRRPRRSRRYDVSPFYTEDLADVYDEAEDLGYEPESFPEDVE